MKTVLESHSSNKEHLKTWLRDPDIPQVHQVERLTGFAVGMLCTRAAIANATLNISEYKLIADVIKDFSALNDEEASLAAYFSVLRGNSQELTDLSVEVLTSTFAEQEFISLLERLVHIMKIDGVLCDGDGEYLCEIYLRSYAAIQRCPIRNSSERASYCQAVLSYVRSLLCNSFKEPTHELRTERSTSGRTSLEIYDPSGSMVYATQIDRERFG